MLSIIVPIINMIFLVWIEYRMMEFHRFHSQVTSRPLEEIDKWGKQQNNTNLYGLISIISTLSVGAVFVILLIKSK
jgi:hypothetical protein